MLLRFERRDHPDTLTPESDCDPQNASLVGLADIGPAFFAFLRLCSISERVRVSGVLMNCFQSEGHLEYCSYIVAILQLLPQLHDCRALAAFMLGGFGEGGDMGVRFEEVADSAAEDAGAVAVNHAHPGETGEKGAVEVLFQLLSGFIHGAADEV